MSKDSIIIAGAREHNLKNIHLTLPREKLIVVTGLSGSGKSSLAFDTIYAEGQRKYVESLSAYARNFLEQLQKPDVDYIEGLSPAIAIEQHFGGNNPRSTIATTTEIYEYLRLLFANIGKPHCYRCGRPITTQTTSQIVEQVLNLGEGSQLMLLAPLVRSRKGEFRDVFARIKREGFVRARVDGEILDVTEGVKLDKRRNHSIELVVDRLIASVKTRTRLADSVETTLKWGTGLLQVLYRTPTTPVTVPWSERLFSSQNACPECGISYGEFTPRHFSFNSPDGACKTCHGLGTKLFFDPDLIVPDRTKSVANGAIAAWRRGGRRLMIYYKMLLRGLSKHYNIDLELPYKDLPEKVQQELLHGSGDVEIEFTHWRKGAWRKISKVFEGVIPNLERLYEETDSEFTKVRLQHFMVAMQCPDCKGARLRPESLAVTVADKSIIDFTRLSIKDALGFLASLALTEFEEQVAGEIIKEVRSRLTFLKNVGLAYLTLDRQSDTLSGGEAQRIRLATQIGAGLVGVLYVLDEPSIGLHQRDNHRLLDTLKGLRDLGNTVIVVEHDEDTIRAADYIVDLGPGAGVHGGYLVAAGPIQTILDSPKSLTGRYLRGELQIPVPKTRHAPKKGWLIVKGADENNLKKIDVRFPLGLLTCVTGVSGSGKSTLVDDILRKALFRKFYRAKDRPGTHEAILGLEELDKVIVIDQSPIGRTPRSNPATYTGSFNHVRTLFAQLPNAKVRGYGPGRFSFNVKGGRCEACQGDGIIKIEMHFLPDVYVTCEQCGGKRYSRETLEITYKGRNIADVLDMTVDEAEVFFRPVPKIRDILQTLQEVGLGYLKIGQQATTLSGGEAQRVKLSTELAKRATGRTLYILDEPTTGLHFADIAKLLEVLNKLRDAGNTVLVIEHNLDVIKSADWIIDLGPEGGDAGGRIIAEGPPEEVAENKKSYTGQFLKHMLARETAPADMARMIYYRWFLLGAYLLAGGRVAIADSLPQSCLITFKVTVQSVPAGSKVFIVGSDEKLGGWNPGAVALKRQDDGSWTGTYAFLAGSRVEYKITRGSWETEAVGADGSVPGNFVLNVQSNETVTIVVANWRDVLHKDTVRKIEGQITGVVKYHRQMVGEGIKPRDVIVWLPPSYPKNPERRYPVLYVQDGQNAFDPATSLFGVDWQIDETADRLIREGKLQEILIVGVYNTADRVSEYSDTPKGRAYMRFIVEKLKPFIDKEYRTLTDREHTAVMGSSLGGLISFLLVWNYPQVFSQAACLSPAFVVREINVNAVPVVESYKGGSKRIRIYMDNGGAGVDSHLQPGCDAMLRALQANGFKIGENLEWYRDPEAEHNEQAWSKRVWRPLIFMYGR